MNELTTFFGMNAPIPLKRVEAPSGKILTYCRSKLSPGMSIPGLSDSTLSRRLQLADSIEVDLRSQKIGDALLAMGVVQALWDYCSLTRPERLPILSATSTFDALLSRSTIPWSAMHRSRLPFRVALRDAPTAVSADLVCDPDRVPCYLEPIDDGRFIAYSALPARYYISLETQVGLRLSRDFDFTPSYRYSATNYSEEIVVCYVTATSLPEKKDYGVHAFQAVASEITRRVAPEAVRHILIGSQGRSTPWVPPLEAMTAETLEKAGALFAAADIVVGNDTGLLHLAALSDSPAGPPQVIGIYGRHSYSKWITGRPNHHAIATAFSEWMHRFDLCPVRDAIDDSLFGAAANLVSISPALLAQIGVTLMSR